MPERPSTAEVEGPEWSARAADWAALCAPAALPVMETLAERTAIGARTRVLDVGCGSGELCALAAARDASVSGLDAAAGMMAIARGRVPGADLRVGAMESFRGRTRASTWSPRSAGDAAMPFTAPDLPGLERAILDGAGFRRVTASASEETVRRTLAEAAAPYRRAGGSYLLRSRVRFIVARA